MTTILIVVLFVLQLLSFYFIIILNTKLARFKDLEKKQERLMREMEDTISLYLTEMKDENNRLISELQVVSKPQPVVIHPIEDNEKVIHQKKQVVAEESPNALNLPEFEVEQRILVPKNIVAKAYNRQQTTTNTTVKQDEVIKEDTFEKQVLQLSKQGKSVEEIAKQLQKGKTEIELLLKFHS